MSDSKYIAADVNGMEILFETSEVKPGDIVIDDDVEDDKAAQEALDAVAAGEPVLPWEDVKARLDLDD